MTRDKERRLVDLLDEKTKKRELDWRLSIGKDSYIISFANSSIIVIPDVSSTKKTIFLEITNDEGNVVDRFNGEELGRGSLQDKDQWTRKLQDIHDGARRAVLKADVILEAILERLEH